jgi:hypothetical protein
VEHEALAAHADEERGPAHEQPHRVLVGRRTSSPGPNGPLGLSTEPLHFAYVGYLKVSLEKRRTLTKTGIGWVAMASLFTVATFPLVVFVCVKLAGA